MAGEAKTSQFLLATATIMVGPVADVFKLTPEDHSIGLVKSVQLQAQPRFTELTQGLTAQVVYSVNTAMDVTISGEMYEYTARNLAYGVGIEAHSADYDMKEAPYTLAGDADSADTTIVTVEAIDADAADGDWFVLTDKPGSDLVIPFKASDVDIATKTLTIAAGTIPTGVTIPAATAKLYRIGNPIRIGTQENNAGYVGVKIVGVLPDGNEPITMIFPKVKLSNGITLAFQTENFGNMPIEFKPFALTAADPFYADFSGNKSSMILRR